MIFLIVENLLFIHQCWAYFANGFSNNIGILEVFRNVVKDLTLDKRVGWSLIYRKLKSLIITYSNSNRSTCDYGEQRNSGDRGTVGTEERKAQRNTGHRGTVSAEEQ